MDALIVGGGPAGTAAAIALARNGRRPTLIERARETGDALCGGFLSWRTLDQLDALGIAADDLNPRRTARVRLFAGTRRAEAPLPRPALAVSRRRLDTLLLDRAVAAGAGVARGVAARAAEDGVRTADGALLRPATLFLATGKHDLRGLARPAAARGDDPAVGLRVRLASSPALDRLVGDAIELHLFDRGYAGLVVQEDGGANLCLAVRRSRLVAAGGDPACLLATIMAEAPALAERCSTGTSGAIEAIANVPYGWRARDTGAGVFRLGDQAAVIPSLAGEGIGIALASGVAAAAALLRGESARAWQRRFARRARRPIAIAGAAWRLVERPALVTPLLPLLAATPALVRALAAATRIDPAGLNSTPQGAT